MGQVIKVGTLEVGGGEPLFLIAGPCVIESYDATFEAASYVKDLTGQLGIPFIFKTSYDKANRTSMGSYRGPGFSKGLDILSRIKSKLGIPILSDIHRFQEVAPAAEVLDVLQIPAFLCRQTDFLLAAAETGAAVNIKKGQFMAPWDMEHAVKKVTSTGNENILLTERGTTFGYNNLVVDFRGLGIMQRMGWPVVFDATHSVQLPGGAGSCSGGQREHVPALAKAAVAAGVDGIFMEVHENPEKALCDGPNSLPLNEVRPLLQQLRAVRTALTTVTG